MEAPKVGDSVFVEAKVEAVRKYRYHFYVDLNVRGENVGSVHGQYITPKEVAAPTVMAKPSPGTLIERTGNKYLTTDTDKLYRIYNGDGTTGQSMFTWSYAVGSNNPPKVIG